MLTTISLSVSRSVIEGQDVEVKLTLDAPSQNDVWVGFRTIDGTAASSSDYKAIDGTALISPVATVAIIKFPTFDDGKNEPNEDFSFALGTLVNAELAGASNASISIQDKAMLAEASLLEGEGDSPVSFSVQPDGCVEGVPLVFQLDNAGTNDVVVTLQTEDGAAIQGIDYAATTFTETVPANTYNWSVHTSIPIFNNSIVGDDGRQFFVRIIDVQGGYVPEGATNPYPFVISDASVDAIDDYAETGIDTPVDISVLGNDWRILSVSSFTQPLHGVVTFDEPNLMMHYEPELGYEGSDSFAYTGTDNQGRSDTAFVSIIVGRAVDLRIWHGQSTPDQNPQGFLPEGKGSGREEFDPAEGALGRGGAFTLANKNDTDNDGRVDNSSNETNVRSASTNAASGLAAGVTLIPVASTNGFAVGDWISIVQQDPALVTGYEPGFDRRFVTAINATQQTITVSEALSRAYVVQGAKTILVTHGGRAEVDLMPLDIQLVGYVAAPPGDVAIEASANSVHFWTDSFKGTEILPDGSGAIKIPAADAFVGKLIWVELTSVSASLGSV